MASDFKDQPDFFDSYTELLTICDKIKNNTASADDHAKQKVIVEKFALSNPGSKMRRDKAAKESAGGT